MKIIPIVLTAILAGGIVTSCSTLSNGEQGVEAVENMTELQFNKWKMYITLGTKIGASRLLEEGLVSANELELTATAVETVRDQTVAPGATSLIVPALEEVGLTNDEVQFLMLVVEQELLARGALDWLDPDTGVVALSPRTKDLLTAVAGSLRAAVNAEVDNGKTFEPEFDGPLANYLLFRQ